MLCPSDGKTNSQRDSLLRRLEYINITIFVALGDMSLDPLRRRRQLQ